MKTSTIVALLAALSLPTSSSLAMSPSSGPIEAQSTQKDPKKKTTKKKKKDTASTSSTKKSTTSPSTKKTTKKSTKKPKSSSGTPRTTTKPKSAPKKAAKKAAKASPKHLTPASPAFMKKAKSMVSGMPSAARAKFLKLLNKGTADELTKIKGIGPVKAANIKKARPFKTVAELANVTGFGEKSFKDVIAAAKKL